MSQYTVIRNFDTYTVLGNLPDQTTGEHPNVEVTRQDIERFAQRHPELAEQCKRILVQLKRGE